jgi:hypothetical protein
MSSRRSASAGAERRASSGAGGGRRYRASELVDVLKRLPTEPLPQTPPRPVKWPEWRASKGRLPFLTAFLLLFVQLLALEWFLRRQWGMV